MNTNEKMQQALDRAMATLMEGYPFDAIVITSTWRDDAGDTQAVICARGNAMTCQALAHYTKQEYDPDPAVVFLDNSEDSDEEDDDE